MQVVLILYLVLLHLQAVALVVVIQQMELLVDLAEEEVELMEILLPLLLAALVILLQYLLLKEIQEALHQHIRQEF